MPLRTESTRSIGRRRAVGLVGAAWGWIGLQFVLLAAIVRLAPYAVEALSAPLTVAQGIFGVGFTLFMLYTEGYRGFQLQFAPRFAARVEVVARHPTWRRVLFAPLFCIGYFDAEPGLRRFIVVLTVVIVASVKLVHLMPQPWRGLLDAGVVLGLTWGSMAVIVSAIRVWKGQISPDPMLPSALASPVGTAPTPFNPGWETEGGPAAQSESV